MATVGQLSPVQHLDPGGLQLVNSKIADLRLKTSDKQKGRPALNELDKVGELSRRKITSLEAQRILAVIDDTIKRAEILTLLPYVVENLNRYSVVLGDSLVRVISEYDSLERGFTQSLRQCRKLSRQSTRSTLQDEENVADESESIVDNDTVEHEGKETVSNAEDSRVKIASREDDELLKERHNIELRLNHNLKTILRLFSQNPNALNLIKVERMERTTEANLYLETLVTLRELAFYRLVTSPKEEKEKEIQLVEVTARQIKSAKLVSKLTSDLDKAEAQKEDEISKRNEVIRHLKSTIHNVEKTAEDLNRKLISEAAKTDAAEMKTSEGKKAKLQQEFIQLKQSLQNQLHAHRESELALRKRKYRMETEVENWIQNFDSDMGERQDEFDELDAVYTEEKKQLKMLEESFKVLEEEYTKIMEERRIARERKEHAELELQRMIKAATVLQSLWRAYKLRKMLKNKTKKKKGKGKGKGKKGGGRKR